MNSENLTNITADNYTQAMLGDPGRRRLSFNATDAATLAHWQQNLRAALWDALGLHRVAERCRELPRAKRIASQTLVDHIREDWRIETEPGFVLPFYLLRPLETAARLPLVITPHGHGRNHRETYAGTIPNDPETLEGERDIALQAVREGYIAIAPQARAFGDTRSARDIQDDACCSCAVWQHRALMFGRTLIGERVWDVMRLVDFSLQRDDIDPDRVMVTGNSGGGTTSLFAAAMDPRITLAVPSCYFCTFADSIGSIQHCACNYIPNILNLAEMWDIAGLITPRPLLIIAGEHDDIFPIDAVRRSFSKLQKIYEISGNPKRCQLFVGEGGHRFYKRPAWDFVRESFHAGTAKS